MKPWEGKHLFLNLSAFTCNIIYFYHSEEVFKLLHLSFLILFSSFFSSFPSRFLFLSLIFLLIPQLIARSKSSRSRTGLQLVPLSFQIFASKEKNLAQQAESFEKKARKDKGQIKKTNKGEIKKTNKGQRTRIKKRNKDRQSIEEDKTQMLCIDPSMPSKSRENSDEQVRDFEEQLSKSHEAERDSDKARATSDTVVRCH